MVCYKAKSYRTHSIDHIGRKERFAPGILQILMEIRLMYISAAVNVPIFTNRQLTTLRLIALILIWKVSPPPSPLKIFYRKI